MWTEQDDKEIEYGKWHVYTAKTTIAEERKVHPPKVSDEKPIRFPHEQTPEHDPIALQQRARHVFDRSCVPLVING